MRSLLLVALSILTFHLPAYSAETTHAADNRISATRVYGWDWINFGEDGRCRVSDVHIYNCDELDRDDVKSSGFCEKALEDAKDNAKYACLQKFDHCKLLKHADRIYVDESYVDESSGAAHFRTGCAVTATFVGSNN